MIISWQKEVTRRLLILVEMALIGILAAKAELFAAYPDGTVLLQRVDQNSVAKTQVVEIKMIIHGRRSDRTLKSRSFIEGQERAFSEYTFPPREQGTKMLKLGDQLWTFDPRTDRTIQISGHLLRQSVMGSDLSYEDMMEDERLSDNYSATVAGSDTVEGRECWILELEGKHTDLAYPKSKIWVDKERYVALKGERFAKSGKLLKSMTAKRIDRLDGRWVATWILYKDELKTGGGTEFIIESAKYDIDIPEQVFSKASLRR